MRPDSASTRHFRKCDEAIMPQHSGFISITDAKEILGDCADLGRLIEEFIIAKHVASDGVVSVRREDVLSLSRVLNRTSVRPPRPT